MKTARAPAARVTQARCPKNWKTLSQAAMKAKYMSPEMATKVPPTSSMRPRLGWWAIIESRNSSTKKAQGLKASSPARIRVRAGSDRLAGSRGPISGRWIGSGSDFGGGAWTGAGCPTGGTGITVVQALADQGPGGPIVLPAHMHLPAEEQGRDRLGLLAEGLRHGLILADVV